MKAPSDLYTLIRSMSKSEKRYFKIYASQHVKDSKNNCIRLFDAIERQEEYDEARIRHQFREERFAKQLPVQKNYLYDLILKSLRAYHSNRTGEMRAKSLLQDAEVLYLRGLYGQCRDALARARAIAEEFELFETELAIIAWSVKLSYATNQTGALDQLSDARAEVLGKLENLNEYFRISLELRRLDSTAGWLGDAESRRKLEELFNHPLLLCEERARSHRALLAYHNAHDVIGALTGDGDRSHRAALRYLELVEERPAWVVENERNRIIALSNAASAAFRVGRMEEMAGHLAALEATTATTPATHARLLVTIYRHSLNLHVRAGEFVKSIDLARHVARGLAEMNGTVDMPTRLTLLYLAAYVHFGAGEYRESLELINEILAAPDDGTRVDIQKAARILSLVLHYELGNADLLPYIIRSVYRYLRRHEQIHHVERALLSLLRRLPGVTSQHELLRLLKGVQEELRHTSADPAQRNLLRYLDVASWLESRIEGRSFAEIVAAKGMHAQLRD